MADEERSRPNTEGGKRLPGLFLRRLVHGSRATYLALLLTLLAGYVIVANAVMVSSMRPYVVRSIRDAKPRDVAIVLGARVYAGGVASPVLVDRAETGALLYSRQRVSRVLVSGGSKIEVDAAVRLLIQRGVPDSAILRDPHGTRTRVSMIRAARVYEIKSAIVCTQSFHLSRAVALARDVGIDAVGIVSDRRFYGARTHTLNHARETLARAVAFIELAF